MSKYSVAIVCAVLGALPVISLEAENDNEAVDKARRLHVPPEEGGDYTVAVSCLDACPAMVWDAATNTHKPGTRPAGAVVSQYQITHPPAAHVAAAVFAKREEAAAAAELAAKREKLKDELRAEIAAENAAASGKAVQS